MPEAEPGEGPVARRRRVPSPRRLLALAGVALLAGAIAAPAAVAQEPAPPSTEQPADPWAGSTFDAPFDVPDATIGEQPFDVAGTLRYQKTGPAEHIVQAEVRIVPRTDLSDRCSLPDPVTVPGPGPTPDLVAELRFDVRELRLPCNGSYEIEVEATLDDPDAPTRTVRQPFQLVVHAPSVTGLSLALDEDARTVTATFTPVPEDELPDDATGYVLERGGPADGEAEGTFIDVGLLETDDAPRFVDDLSRAAGGTYTYRVRTVRGSGEESQRSSAVDAETATITIGDPTGTPPPKAGATRGPRRGNVSVARRGITAPRRSTTVTTLDTGFEGTIDYGGEAGPGTTADPGADAMEGDVPLAGQSVIQDEGEGVDVAVPAAGALVLLGWAGHIAYLNRLAKLL